MSDDQRMDALIATAFQATGEPTEALEDRLDTRWREYESRHIPASIRRERMKHATMIAVWIAMSLLGLGAVGAAVYKQMYGDLYQNGKKIGTFNPGKHGDIEIHSTPDQMSNGMLELKRADGGPSLRVFVDKGTDKGK